ncbi:MAG: cytochrome c-type biogenesis CcmF C-terminal domain-containing protein [Chloroflexota bacterium]
MATIGYIALFLALLASTYTVFAGFLGARRKQRALVESGRLSMLTTTGLISLASLILLYALLTHQFQIEYVANYSSRETSLAYLISCLWAGNAGSLLFWAWLLSIFAVLSTRRWTGNTGDRITPYASAVMMFTEAFLLLILLTILNPFRELAFAPPDGRGLNPILENPGMIIHPPALLAGYVGFTIPFAFAIGALLARHEGNEWLAPARTWAFFAWLLLGAGNLIGAWWAYVELGWGGYWAWDPVENAGLMPWLVATAFLHSIMLQKRSGALKTWNMLLIILAFNLAVFGTYLTRSNILSSVHTFGETGLEPFFLTFLTITFFGSLVLLYRRREVLASPEQEGALLSREGAFQLNNVLLVGSALIILLGTMFPAFFQLVRGAEISMDASFFNQTNMPIFLTIVLLIGICTLLRWKQDSFRTLGRQLAIPAAIALVTLVLLLVFGVRQWYALAAFPLCALVITSIAFRWGQDVRAARSTRKENYGKTFWKLLTSNRTRYGGYLVHIAIIFIAVGVTGSSLFDRETEVTLKPHDSLDFGNYTLTYEDINYQETASKLVVTTRLSVYRGDRFLTTLTPEKSFHRNFEQPVTEVAIRTTPVEDLYVILSGWDADGTTAFKILLNPLVLWIWVGGGILVVGGALALLPRRGVVPLPKPPVRKTPPGNASDEIERQVREIRQIQRRFCPRCGAKTSPDTRFCTRCGEKLD